MADGLDEAMRGVHDFLDREEVWDEEKAGEEFYEDALTPALQALANVVAGVLWRIQFAFATRQWEKSQG